MGNTVSVGMTTYNSAKYVREQLESILNQTILPDEIVICDDASTDDTVAILHSVLDNIGGVEIRILVNPYNIGAIKNFEKCFLLCKCDIIISCDADDIWFPQKIEQIKKRFDDDENVVYVYHDAIIIDGEGNKIADSLNATWDYLDNKEDLEQILLRNIKREGFPYGMTMAFRRNLLQEITPFMMGHDGWINMCAPLFGGVCCIHEPLTYYRRHGNNTSGKTNESLLHKMKRMDKDAWFCWPGAFVYSYQKYADIFADRLPKSVQSEAEKQIAHKKFLVEIVEEKSRIVAISKLIRSYHSEYKRYRGNWKMLLVDCFFIIQNRKD